MDRPVGALSEVERRDLQSRFDIDGEPRTDRCYFAVETNGRLHSSDKFAFSWSPGIAYYFDNYWHAWAYHLRLTTDKNQV